MRAAALAFCARLLAAQALEPEVAIRTDPYTPPSAVLHAESNLVGTQFAVRDPIGRTVAGLHASLDFTSDSHQFAQSLDRANLHTHVYHSIEEYEADSGNLLSAVAAAARRLSAMQDERILVLLSSGFIIHISREHDAESRIQKVVDAALRYNVLVHAIDGKGLSTSPTLALNRPLRELSNGVGGHFFENTNGLAGPCGKPPNPKSPIESPSTQANPTANFTR